ncbi:MAG: hypothetical protein ACREBC_13335 [Pyrinomonadaceae bacterium]
MRKVRSTLVTLLLLALVIRVLWWTVEPLIPYLIAGIFIIGIIGFIFGRATRL